jgi:hypothetical protein
VQTFNTLRKLLSAASLVRDAAFETKTLEFLAPKPLTFYLDTQDSEVIIRRWPQAKISVRVRLQVGFGWHLENEQDDAGVYVVAKRKLVVGSFSRAEFDIALPDTAHVVLKLADSVMLLDDVTGTFQIPAPALQASAQPSTSLKALPVPQKSTTRTSKKAVQ